MPKKRNSTLKRLQGSSSAINTGPSAAIHHGDRNGQQQQSSHTELSVNDRLNQLRLAPTPESQRKKRALADQANQPSVPPQLGSLLGVPETAPPRPKLGARFRDRMRTPGPAPPKSWLGFASAWESSSSQSNRNKKKKMAKSAPIRKIPDRFMRFARLTGSYDTPDRPRGLVHMALKRLAETWYAFDEEEYPVFTEMPLRLRLHLISYIGYYGHPIDGSTLETLTYGMEDVHHLDLSGLAGYEPLTMKRIVRVIEGSKRRSTTKASMQIAESWDEDDSFEEALTMSIPNSRFLNLTHLSLSHPPPTASWRDLLSMSKHIPQLTHLSLAYWPRPTLTPNLMTATISTRNSPEVRAGGSHYYSGIEQDLTEPAALLRQLSSNLLCLQWLDVEGCHEWVPALAILAASVPVEPTAQVVQRDPGNGNDWIATKPSAITIFTDTWRNLNYIRCSQGWLPTSSGINALDFYIDRELLRSILTHLRQTEPPDVKMTHDIYDVEKRRARIWIESETRLLAAFRRINNIRRARSCKPIMIDYGWFSKAV